MYHEEGFYGLGADDSERWGLGLTLPWDTSGDGWSTPFTSIPSGTTSDSGTPWWGSILQTAARTVENVLTPYPPPSTYPTYPAIYTPPIIPAPTAPGFPPSYTPYGGGIPSSVAGISTPLLIGGALLLFFMSKRRRAASAAI